MVKFQNVVMTISCLLFSYFSESNFKRTEGKLSFTSLPVELFFSVFPISKHEINETKGKGQTSNVRRFSDEITNKKSLVTQTLETISNLKTESFKNSFNFGHIVKFVLFL